MPVYVDNMKAPFGRMIMCHMWAGRLDESGRYVLALDELLEMADRIGVARRWLQCPPKASWYHFDIAQSKRAMAIGFGAIETDRYGPIEHVHKLTGNQWWLDRVAAMRARKQEPRPQ